MSAQPVLEGRDLVKEFSVGSTGRLGRRARLRAVAGVSLQLQPGRITAVVGESGSGKTTLARLLARILRPDSGEVLLDGAPAPRSRRVFARQVQMVFQDPFASLNPVHRVRHHLERPLRIHGTGGQELDGAVVRLLDRVALDAAAADKFPHELSGGQRQRVAIARALAAKPRALLADEPVSMLDVSIRLGVLNLLGGLRDTEGLAILYITHDIGSARYLADDIAVMYAGEVVETAPSTRLTDEPAHPYTQLLLATAPDPQRGAPARISAAGSPPNLAEPPPGCRFHPRCPFAMEICSQKAPQLLPIGPDRQVACWLHAGVEQRRNGSHAPPLAGGEPRSGDNKTKQEVEPQ